MADATSSHARMRDLARLGRSRPRSGATFGARPVTGASRRQRGTDAGSIAAALPSRPRAASPRPGRTIWWHQPSRIRRLDAGEHGYTLVELLIVMLMLGAILTGLTLVFMRAYNAELAMNKQFQAQQEARTAVDRMRREIHCSSGITPSGNSTSIAVTLPSQCPTAGGSQIVVTYDTQLVSTGRYRLRRAGVRVADYITANNVFTYSHTTGKRANLHVELPVNIQPTDAGKTWRLAGDIVLRNTPRL
jgi:prepilin-type N-terminal cleavage/methylation domain-containing protein